MGKSKPFKRVQNKMREIKFRVWNKEKKMWVNTDEHAQFVLFNLNHLIVTQFTGLKDKNNKEIYEGDIGISKMFDDRINKWVKRKFKVMPLDEGCFSIEGINNKYWNPLLCSIIGDTWTVEIIGNIYENKKLMEGHKNGT